MTDSYDDILNSLDDDNNYYSVDGDNISPSLQAWSNSADIEELDLDSFNISSDSDASWVDPLESAITATRNGSAPILSTLSQFTTILSQTGVHGPRLLKATNLSSRATKIGSGAQFTVFKDPLFEGEVIKRVNVPLTSRAEQRFAASNDYRLQLKTLELEILSLCNPVLRAHPNITSLLAWGFDFPFADLAVPVLFMEAAIMPLGDFLSAENRSITVRYQFALDIANGLEALHHLKIVHGDVKPDNVLVFAGLTENVPFQAKLSDFGVCVDLEAPDGRFSLSDYRGTPAWLAPELISGDISKFGKFSPDLMFRFDAYSFGLVLLSIFTGNGQLPNLDKTPEKVSDQVSKLLNGQQDIPSDMRMELRKGMLNHLAEDPRDRKLPSPNLLKFDSPGYGSWYLVPPLIFLTLTLISDIRLASIQSSAADTHVGIIDPIYNKGPLFWYRLDQSIRTELETQYTLGKDGNAPPFGGNVLFGIAQTITGEKGGLFTCQSYIRASHGGA
jgi:serine/threonine protein kinase